MTSPSHDGEPRARISRGQDGRFLKGCEGGPGNPRVRRLGAYQQALHDAITPEALQAVVKTMLVKALAGNTDAARALLDRCLGKGRSPGVDLGNPEAMSPIDIALAASRAVVRGDLDPADGRAITAAVRDIEDLRIMRDLERRIAELEGRS